MDLTRMIDLEQFSCFSRVYGVNIVSSVTSFWNQKHLSNKGTKVYSHHARFGPVVDNDGD